METRDTENMFPSLFPKVSDQKEV